MSDVYCGFEVGDVVRRRYNCGYWRRHKPGTVATVLALSGNHLRFDEDGNGNGYAPSAYELVERATAINVLFDKRTVQRLLVRV